MLIKLLLFFIIEIYLCLNPFLAAQGAFPPIIINEIAWMGNSASYANEWIELYNNNDSAVNLGGWMLKSENGKLKINLSGTVPAKGFYLLEKTNDSAVPNIKADLIYKGALNNKGEDLTLYDNSGKLIDEVNCSSGWFAGNNKTKQTMERINPLLPGNNAENWQISRNPGGTPKTINSEQKRKKYEKKKTRLLPKKDKVGSRPAKSYSAKAINYPAGIVFSEILPSPEGPDAKNEWIEIHNQNKFSVNLSGWQIKDKKGKITAYVFPAGTKISSLGYLVLKRPETKIILNNGGDGLELINPDKKVVDSVVFGKAPLNQSYNRISRRKRNWQWSALLTPRAKNIISASTTSSAKQEQETRSPVLKQESGSPLSYSIEKETADAGEKIPKSFNHFFALSIPSIIAVSSATAILFLKKSIMKKL